MKIRHLLLPSGITDGIPVLVESRWTPEQAVAVIELLDDLREQIMRHYAPQIQAHIRDERVQNAGASASHPEIDDETF
jgi:hypothetical protein